MLWFTLCYGVPDAPRGAAPRLLPGEMESGFFQSLIARRPWEEMSYKVQRPLPTARGREQPVLGCAG